MIYVLNVVMDLTWMFRAFLLNRWIMESLIYDFEELVELVMQISKIMEAFWVLM